MKTRMTHRWFNVVLAVMIGGSISGCWETNHTPVAVDDAVTVTEDSANNLIDVLANDTGKDKGILPILSIKPGSLTTPNHGGTVTISNGKVSYAPAVDFYGTETFQYTVADGNGGEDNGTVTVTVTPVNDAPEADATANPTTVNQGNPVTFDSSGSTDSDGSIASYVWEEGGTLLHNGASFTKSDLTVGTHTITLTVTDNDGAKATDSVTVTVNPIPNKSPVANAGADQTVIQGTAVTLDGSGSSDSDGTIASYEWKEGGTVLATMVSFTKSNFSAGSHTITLTVTDNDGAKATDAVNVTVNASTSNQSPEANAGADQTVTQGTEVTLDGSASSDPDGTIASYEWKEGNTLLADTKIFTKTFSVGTHTITLTVTDNDGATDTDSVTVTVNSASATTSQLKKTGQTKSYDENGNEVTDGSLKDDGYYKKGVEPSYTRDDTKEVVIDHITGLMWQDDAHDAGTAKPWLTEANFNTCYNDTSSAACYDTSGDTAATYCADLTLGGYTDWRLPTISELMYIADRSKSYPAIDTSYFHNLDYEEFAHWSSSVDADSEATQAWSIDFGTGLSIPLEAKSRSFYVRCVRTAP